MKKQVETNNQYGTLERVAVDGYEGYLAVQGPSYNIKRSPDGRFVTGGRVVLNGLVIRGEAALDFRSEIKFSLAEDNIPEDDPETARFARGSVAAPVHPGEHPGGSGPEADHGTGGRSRGREKGRGRHAPEGEPSGRPRDRRNAGGTPGVGGRRKKGDLFFRFEPSTEVSFSLRNRRRGGRKPSFPNPERCGSGPLPWTGTAPSANRNRSK